MTAQTPSPNRAANLGSRWDLAAPVGMTVKTKIERGDRYSAPEVYHLEITVLDSLRGSNAIGHLKAEDVSPPPARAGFEYLLVYIRLGYFSKGRGFGHVKEPYVIEKDTFTATSADGKTPYAPPEIDRQPKEPLIGTAFSPGQSNSGRIIFQVPETEKNPLIAFKRDYRENSYGSWGAVWFSI
jgi:hypothetical protein